MKRKLFLTLLLIWGISVSQESQDSSKDSVKSSVKNESSEKEEKKDNKSNKKTLRKREENTKVAAPVKVQDASTAVEIEAGVMFGEFQREDGPFLLKGNIIVPSGQILKFGPGCQIYVGGKYTTITVFGQIDLEGTASEPVIIQSASKNPNPWDWDRIYIRSRRRSTISHAIIRHSNYGVVAENSSVVIKNSVFEKNSIHGLVVKNSNVRISNSEFRKGHLVSILLQAGADVSADSISIRNNRCALACDDKAYFIMKKGKISDNRYGLAVDNGASVEIIAADITKNSVGIMSTTEIPKKMAEMVYQNSTNLSVVTQDEFVKLIKAPEDVKSVALPTTKKEITVSKNFAPGFSALKQERVKTASFIGNVSLGVDYYRPDSKVHPTDRDTIWELDITTIGDSTVVESTIARIDSVFKQTKYPGEHQDEWYAGLTPKLVFFAQGKRGDLDVNLNADIEVNSWYGGKLWDPETQLLVDTLITPFIDTVINGTDTSITKAYDTSYSEGKAPFKFNTLVFSTNFRDQHVTLGDFYENISEASISSRKLRGLKYTGSFWDMGRGNKRIDVHLAFGQSEAKEDIGDHDKDVFGEVTDTSYSTRQQMTYVASGNLRPIHNLTLTARGLISHDQHLNPLLSDPLVDDSVANPISAATGGLGFDVKLLDGKLDIYGELNIGKDDTLWLETGDYYWDDKPEWYKPQIIPALQTVFSEIGDAFDSKSLKTYAIDAGVSGTVSGFDLSCNYLLLGEEYFSAGNPYLENDRMLLSASGKKDFTDKLTATLNYEFERTSLSEELNVDSGNADPLNSNSFDLGCVYSFGENLPGIDASYQLQIQSNEDITDSLYYTPTVDSLGDSVYEATTTKAAVDFMEIQNSGSIKIKQRFENGIDYSLKYNFRNTNDATEYLISAYDDLDDTWEHGIEAKIGFRVKRILRNKTGFKIKFKNTVEDNEEQIDWKVSENLSVDIIPRKLKLKLIGSLRNKKSEEDDSDNTEETLSYKTLQKTLEGELKYIINSKLSATLSAKIEDYDDDVSGSTENYTLQSGGLHFIYLF